jgi:DNA-binding NarL/FixJ family response regulator
MSSFDKKELNEQLRDVVDVIGAEATFKLVKHFAGERICIAKNTAKRIEARHLLQTGMTVSEIAKKTHLTQQTIYNYQKNKK